MRWVATVSGSAEDVERVLAEGLLDMSRDLEDPHHLLLDLGDVESDDETEPLAAKELADAYLRSSTAAGDSVGDARSIASRSCTSGLLTATVA